MPLEGTAVSPQLLHRRSNDVLLSEQRAHGVTTATHLRDHKRSSRPRNRENGWSNKDICRRIQDFFEEDQNVICTLFTVVVILLILCLVLISMCGWLLLTTGENIFIPDAPEPHKSIDKDAIMDLWRLFDTASRTKEEYHMHAFREYLLRYKRLAEERQKREDEEKGNGKKIRSIDVSQVDDPSAAVLPRFTAAPEKTLPEVLTALRSVMEHIVEQDRNKGLEKAAVYLTKNFWRMGKTVHNEKESLLGTEKEAFEPFDDILYLQLRRYFDGNEDEKELSPHLVSQFRRRKKEENKEYEKKGKQWWDHVRTNAPSVHTGRFYYPLRRFHRMRGFSAETAEVTAAWIDAMAYDYFEDSEEITPFIPPELPTSQYIESMKEGLQKTSESLFSSFSSSSLLTSSPEGPVFTGTLFVNLASFRDKECWPSTGHMLKRAGNMFRVYYGIAEQHRETDLSCVSYDALLPRSCMSSPATLSSLSQSVTTNPKKDGEEGGGEKRKNTTTLNNNNGIISSIISSITTTTTNNNNTSSSSNSNSLNNNRYGGSICFPVDNIRVRHIRPSAAYGPTYGRYMGMLLYRGEDYALVLDSHNRFVYGWDIRIVAMYIVQEHPKLVLSHYPESYLESEGDAFQFERKSTAYLCRAQFLQSAGYLRLSGIAINSLSPFKRNNRYLYPYVIAELHLNESIPRPLPQPWAAGGFLFANATIMREVPFDPHLPYIFDGEEIMYSVRLWTHGYDIHSPMRGICFHFYGRKDQPKLWLETPRWNAVQGQSRKRIQYLLRSRVRGVDVLRVPRHTQLPVVVMDADRYGVGRARSVQEWYAFAGVDPVHYTVDGRWCGG
ncbi:Glycosyltransferase [Trypanosoma melophagium]|uniref:Glycosyltransferase n=1 Tax=Trypanosoma melophagium TaxID=715481 RepID=UPI00351A8EC6|nr:Glycosyltransferase [Trypanosoma melophagium]